MPMKSQNGLYFKENYPRKGSIIHNNPDLLINLANFEGDGK